jgi:hypothetical protein
VRKMSPPAPDASSLNLECVNRCATRGRARARARVVTCAGGLFAVLMIINRSFTRACHRRR